ncbi:MAG TPA: alkaline phosphatase D family protein, partial [Solirubrobacteraceae bacterium]|nr:alkaline phosphatase D family protein [Solirubrobacteraceae bacterium]
MTPALARLVLGPLLRYVGDEEAIVWVETDRACTVEVLGCSAPTFCVAGHHYGLVCVSGLESGACVPYQVHLDGERCWPLAESPFPESVIRTRTPGQPVRLAFGSCRVSLPHEPPYALSKDRDDRGREVDALLALVGRLRTRPPREWPDALLLLGDQVYADQVSPETERLIKERRGSGVASADEPPQGEVADFEEYTWLYREAWSDPATRWLLSTISSAMIFDDHDVHDDWNASWAWVREIRTVPWWHERILGAYMSYWIYQHLGNLSPAELAENALLASVREAQDAEEILRAFAKQAEEEVAGTRWSYQRDFGRTRLLVLDSRAGRVLDEDRREMLSEPEWAWVEECVTGDFDHLLIATTLPLLLSHGLHHLEAWNEAVCDGAWGRTAARLGEKIRQAIDLEHWSAFHESFIRLTDLLHEVASGGRGPAPASVIVLSGDVHHAYLAEASFPGRAPIESALVQAVCSPIRNPLDRPERRALRAALSRSAAAVARLLARSAGVRPAAVRWEFAGEPTFDNQIATLHLTGRSAQLTIEKTRPE